MVLTNLVEGYTRNIHTKFLANLCSGLRVEKVRSLQWQQQWQRQTQGDHSTLYRGQTCHAIDWCRVSQWKSQLPILISLIWPDPLIFQTFYSGDKAWCKKLTKHITHAWNKCFLLICLSCLKTRNFILKRSKQMFLLVFVFYVHSTARSFRDGTTIYCPLRRTWSSVNTLFPPGIKPRVVAWQSITLPLCHAFCLWRRQEVIIIINE